MVKVVFNSTPSGFTLSPQALKLYNQRRVEADPQATAITNLSFKRCDTTFRSDPLLVGVVEQLGKKASRKGSIKIVDIPEAYRDCFTISDHNGWEYIECYPENLIAHKLRLATSDLTPEELQNFLQELKDLAQSATGFAHYQYSANEVHDDNSDNETTSEMPVEE